MRAGTETEMECLLQDHVISDAPVRKKAKSDVENDSITPNRPLKKSDQKEAQGCVRVKNQVHVHVNAQRL